MEEHLHRSHQCQWVQRNHERPERIRPVSTVIRNWRAGREDRQVPHEVACEVAKIVGAQMAGHVRLCVDRGRRLIVFVDEPSMVDLLRRQCAERIRAMMAAARYGIGLRDVAFRYGTSGLELPHIR